MQIGNTSSGADGVLHHPPEAFDGVEMVTTMGGEAMEAKRSVVVIECRVELVRPMDTAAIDDHHDVFAGFAEGCHHLMDVLAQCLGVTMGHNFREDFGSPVLHGPNDAESYPAGDTAPRAIRQPRLAFEAFFAFALTLTQRTGGQTRALGAAPPAQPGEGKAPQDRFIFVEQNDLAPTRSGLQGSEVDRAIGEVGRGGIEPPGGTAVASCVFFHTQRTLSRPSWTPGSRAKTVASSRQLHWEWREPCSRGS
jgi:hypothetical protein